MNGRIIYSFLIALLGFIDIECFSQRLNFRHLTTEDGLITANTLAIIEDYQGFYWFGTEEGLQRYDGYTFKNYQFNERDSSSIGSNFIKFLFEDSKKNLWIATQGGGLCWYDRAKDKFIRFQNNPSDKNSVMGNFIRLIFEDKNGVLYVGLEGGLSYFKIPDKISSGISFTNVTIPRNKSNPGAQWVSSIIENDDHTFLVAVNGMGVNIFLPGAGEFKPALQDSISLQIQCMFVDSRKRLWIGSWDNGLYIVDKHSKKMVHHISKEGNGFLSQNQILTIGEDAEGNFWIGTDKGMSVIDHTIDPFSNAPFYTIKHDDNNSKSLLSNAIKLFYIDKMKRVWIGSYFGGLNIYDKNALGFNYVQSKNSNPQGLSHNNVYALEEDDDGNLWIGTDGGGLNVLKGSIATIYDNKFNKISLTDNGQVAEKIKCLRKDHAGNLWIGTWGNGMFRLNTKNNSVRHFGKALQFNKGLSADEILSIEVDSLNNLWIGTFSNGVSYFDQRSNTFTHYTKFSDSKEREINRVFDIQVDHRGNVWVARESGGLSLFNPTNKLFQTIDIGPLKKDLTIISIYEDSAGSLWLGTNSIGMLRYDHQTKAVESYNTAMGLADNTVHAIVEDTTTNTLWLSTNKGISSLDLKTHHFNNYTKTDGLQDHRFNDNCACFHSSRSMLFGGIRGLSIFKPDNIQNVIFNPPIVFTRFWLNGKEFNAGDAKSPLTKNIILTDSLTLEHFQNSFSIEFAALYVDFAHQTRYSYKLENFSDTWFAVADERKATFTNLDPGNYVLHIRATNSGGVLMDNTKKLILIIKHAWWQTKLFKALVLLLLVIGLYLIFKIRLRYLTYQQKKLKNQVAEGTKELRNKNAELELKIEEINNQNHRLHIQKIEIAEKNQEIQAQNEELISQNDQIILQQTNLESAHTKLMELNTQLDLLVQQRTRKLEETIKELDIAVSELDRFVYSASHDLSAPLKSVLGLVNIARQESNPEQVQLYYDYIERSILKLDGVIKSLVEFSRNTHQEITLVDINIYQIVNEVMDELAFWPEARKIKLANLIDNKSIMKSDVNRIKVILHNLIGNGIKYADLTKTDPTIWIEFRHNNDSFELVVRDNGIGIELWRQDRIFDMYYKASERSKGSGLGLFIVKEVIKKLKGNIDVQSEFGAGTTFTLTFQNHV